MQRMLAVLAWLATNERTTVDELADRFGISRHQMEKDLALATMSSYGPEIDAGNFLEFYIDDDGTVEAYALKRDLVGPTRLTRAEAFAVLTAGRAALDLDPSLEALRSAMSKLANALGTGMDEVIDVDLRGPGCLADFRLAEADRRVVRIGYWSASRDEVTERTVEPIRVFFRDGYWYSRCVDHPADGHGRAAITGDRSTTRRARERTSEGAVRLFRLDRVMTWEITAARFEASSASESTDDLLDLPPDSIAVTIRFPESSRWVNDYFELRQVHEAGGSIIGVLDVVGIAFLDQLLVRARGEVLEPPELAGRTQLAAEAILARYR